MKEASGEVNMTVVTIVAIGLIAAFFAGFFPQIKAAIESNFSNSTKEISDMKNQQKQR